MTKIILATLFASQFALATSPAQTVRPTPPTYENCAGMDLACSRRNEAARNNYNTQLGAYNEFVRIQNETNRNTDAGAIISNTPVLDSQTSVTQNLQEAVEQNDKGTKKYSTVQVVTMATSVALMGAYVTTCATVVGCQPPLLYGSMAFAAISMLAKGRKEAHTASANQACIAQAQVSAAANTACVRTDDGVTTPTTWPPSGPTLTEVFPVNPDGTCTGTAEQCQAITDSLPPGVNIRDVATGLSSFANNGGKPLFTVSPDGTVTDKNGKKIPASAFTSEKGLTGLGMSPSAASALLSDLNKSGGGSLTGDDKSKTASLPNSGKDVGGTFGDGGFGGGTISVNNEGPNGAVDEKGKDIGGGAGAAGRNNARDVASAEGLVKDFNGELIGVASDDIFKMMNRRYILKDTQDSFIAPVAP